MKQRSPSRSGKPPKQSGDKRGRSGTGNPRPEKSTRSGSAPAHIPAKPAMTQRLKPASRRLRETVPLILETRSNQEYALLDSGNGRKLERYGPYIIERPEAQAFWQPVLDRKIWQQADAIFTGEKDEEGMGRWNFPKTPLGETWPLFWEGNTGKLDFHGRFTSFRHVGNFPEQAAHWQFIEQKIAEAGQTGHQPSMLNLFGYTGIASLVAAKAGAKVTHVDASKKAIGWARENQQLARLEQKPIRWICDDAVKFCEREIRRGNSYDAIILDPPKYGRGPKGEVWQLFESLPYMVDLCRQLVSKNPTFVILTSYAIQSSFHALHELMQEVFGDMGGELQSGELVIRTLDSNRSLSTSLFSRWIAEGK